MDQHSHYTDFGYERVQKHEKAAKVGAVFDSVADNYDVMNDLMSMGLHRLWKRFCVASSLVKPGDYVLDLAGGTGDLSRLFARRVGKKGLVVLADINRSMLEQGRCRLLNEGLLKPLDYTQANAEQLPFADNSFDCITIAFGLRNVTDKDQALRSMYRVLKPGGRLLVLEFSQPTLAPLQPLYDIYSFSILPKLGQWIANDADSYRYLAESIRRHPNQITLKNMIQTAGFEDCHYHNLCAGIVALHKAYKY